MAVCEIRPVHTTPARTLKYVTQPEKTQDGALVFCNQCSTDWQLANLQMEAHRKKCGKEDKILAHHGYVSFPGNEVTPEKALEIAEEFMEGYFKNHQYLGSVHVDTDNVHFNFVINSVGLDGKKYLGKKETLHEVRAWVDTCCEKHGLSVVKSKENKKVAYKEWMEEKQGGSWKGIIKADIDQAISKSENFEQFLNNMKDQGYYIKHGENVKHMVFKKGGMERGSRGSTLGNEYTEESIKTRIKLKEFNFMPPPKNIKFRSAKDRKRKLSAKEKELWRLYYRRGNLATNFALGIHLIHAFITGNKNSIERFPDYKKRKIYEKATREIKHLEGLFRFIKEEGIQNQEQLHLKVRELNQTLMDILGEESEQETTKGKLLAKEVKIKLGEYYDLKETLQRIRTKDVLSDLEKEVSNKEKRKTQRER